MKNKSKLVPIALLLSSSLLLSACTDPKQNVEPPIEIKLSDTKVTEKTESRPMQNSGYKELADFKEITATQAVFETTKGTLVFDLYRDQTPLTTANFLNLIDSGFYDGIIFHRVIADFMAQVGDPLTKDPSKEALWGTGGPDYRIKDEFDPSLRHDAAGILSMANSGPNTGGSQIFITYSPQPHLDGKHAVFGKLVEGMDVLTSIQKGDKITKASYR